MRAVACALLAGFALVGCQGLEWPFGPRPDHVVGEDPPDCDAPDTCVSRGCGTVCSSSAECPTGLACLRFLGVARGFCSRFCDADAEDDRCGCGWRCVELDSVSGTPVFHCVEPCARNRDCDLPGWYCTGSWHCVPPEP